MKWIEEKMKLLGCDRHSGYKLAFYLDSRAMISIHSDKYGVIEVKTKNRTFHFRSLLLI